jgi:hypothetical protein
MMRLITKEEWATITPEQNREFWASIEARPVVNVLVDSVNVVVDSVNTTFSDGVAITFHSNPNVLLGWLDVGKKKEMQKVNWKEEGF